MHRFHTADHMRTLFLFASPVQPFASHLFLGFATVIVNVVALHCCRVLSSVFGYQLISKLHLTLIGP